MFNGLDELEDFAACLAPLTPEELAAWKKKKASVETERAEAEPVSANTAEIALVQEVAPELGTVPAPVSEIVSDLEPPLVQVESPGSAPAPARKPEVIHKVEAQLPEPADERECGRESESTPVQTSVPEIEAVQQAEVSEAHPVLVSQSESAPEPEPEPEQVAGATIRPYARYVVVGGLLLLGLAALLL